jgi:hypothetical protein
MRTILFLATESTNSVRLRLEEEVREIQKGLRRTQKRSDFSLEVRWVARPRDVQRAMLEVEPNIVHFVASENSSYEALAFQDEAGQAQVVSEKSLASLFKLFKYVECVILSRCYSLLQAEAIAQSVNYVIGISTTIDRNKVLKFSIGFYDALAANRSIEEAYKFGCNSLELEEITNNIYPVLYSKILKSRKDIKSPLNRLAIQHSQLEDLYELLTEKLNFLKKEIAITTSPSTKFELQKQIQEIQGEIRSIELELEVVDINKTKIINNSQAYNLLLQTYEQKLYNSMYEKCSISEADIQRFKEIQLELNIREEDIEIISQKTEAQIILNDVEEIRSCFTKSISSIQDYQKLAKAIARRMKITDAIFIRLRSYNSGSIWEVSLPRIGLKMRSNKALMFLRKCEKNSDFHQHLAEIVFEKNAVFLIVIDILDIRLPPMQIGPPTIWFRPESLIEMATLPENELLGWLGRFITTQIDVCSLPGLLPYQTSGAAKEELFFGRDYELTCLIGGTVRGGIIIGAHRSGKTSLLYQLAKRLKQQGHIVVDVLTLGGIDSFESFIERTLDSLNINLPSEVNPSYWAESLRNYVKVNKKVPIFLLDEVDDLISLDTQSNFHLGKQMRSLQSDGYCHFFLAGHAKLRTAIEVEGGPFRNFAEEITLTGLTEAASIRLIQQPMKLIGFEVTDKQAYRIFKGTAGVAVLIQEFCIRLLRELREVNIPVIEDNQIAKIEKSPEYLGIVFEHFQYAQKWDSMAVLLITSIFGEINKRNILKEINKQGATLSILRLDKILDFLVRFGVLEEFKPSEYKVLPNYLHCAIIARDPELQLESVLHEEDEIQ